MRNSSKIVLSLVVIVLASFLWIHASDYIFEYGNTEYEDTQVQDISYGAMIRQCIQIPDKHVNSLGVKFATYENHAKGNIEVYLLQNDSVLKTWIIDTSLLSDNDYYKYDVKSIEFNDDNVYELQIQSDTTAESIAIYVTGNSDGTLEEQGICYKYYYTNIGGIALIIVILVMLAVLFVVSCFKVQKNHIMMILLTMVGIIYFAVFPLGEIPDENGHFYRAFEVSCGSMISEQIEGGGGACLPVALTQYRDNTASIDWSNGAELVYSNTALYAAVCYFPQALGIRITRFFTDNVSMIFYAGRLANFLVSLLLSLWALKKMPFAKEVLFIIMMFPMTLQEMVSMAPDGMTNALSFAFIAYVLHLAYESEKITKRDLALLMILGITISLCKIVYVVEILLLFILPAEKLGGKKRSLCFKLGVPGIAVILNLIWLKISSGFLVEFNPGVDTGKQVVYVLTHLHEYYAVVVRTITANADNWVKWMFGESLGTLSISISGFVWISLLILLVYEILNVNTELELRRSDIVCYWMIVLGGCALIATSLYVQWTPYKSGYIDGIQGRYFIPLLMPLLLPVTYRKRMVIGEDTTETIGYLYFIIVFLEGMALIDILKYFIV